MRWVGVSIICIAKIISVSAKKTIGMKDRRRIA